MRLMLLLAVVFSTSLAYGKFNRENSTDEQLKQELYEQISQHHRSLGYDGARRALFGSIALQEKNGRYVVRDVYCEIDFDVPGPNRIPNPNIINTEHTWPQSRFGGRERDMQKSDLHHLYPSDNELNSIRGNNPFGEVGSDSKTLKCPKSKSGVGDHGRWIFEPPQAHKGNVARALFYFSVRYGLSIDSTQEAVLKKWNKQDPVDAAEMSRNNMIEKLQGNRNPFIDNPDLANSIRDF